MGYKSSQTIAAISWKTLHHYKNIKYSPLENISKQNQCWIHSYDGTDKYSRGNKSVLEHNQLSEILITYQIPMSRNMVLPKGKDCEPS